MGVSILMAAAAIIKLLSLPAFTKGVLHVSHLVLRVTYLLF